MKQAITRTYEQARRMNAPRAIALCQCFNGALEFQAGHWDEAEATLRESIRLYREIGAASGEAIALQRLGALQTARSQYTEAMTSFEEGVIVAERAAMRAHCLTRLYTSMTRNRLTAGALEAAEHYLALGLAMGERHGNCVTCYALLLPAAVSVRVAQGNLSAAEDFCRRLDQASEKYSSRIWVAMALQSRAELIAAEGNLDRAIALYHEAYEIFKIAGNDYEAAHCLSASSSIRARRRMPADDQAAPAEQTEAQEIYARLGVGL